MRPPHGERRGRSRLARWRILYRPVGRPNLRRLGVGTVDQQTPTLLSPYAMDPARPDRVPKQRYVDPDFYALEAEHLWPRVWQMACRLEEIPTAHDVVEYEFLDQSVIVVRTEDLGVRAFENTCRHRGVRLVDGRTTC